MWPLLLGPLHKAESFGCLVAPSLQAMALLMPLETEAFTWPSMSSAGAAGLRGAGC